MGLFWFLEWQTRGFGNKSDSTNSDENLQEKITYLIKFKVNKKKQMQPCR